MQIEKSQYTTHFTAITTGKSVKMKVIAYS